MTRRDQTHRLDFCNNLGNMALGVNGCIVPFYVEVETRLFTVTKFNLFQSSLEFLVQNIYFVRYFLEFHSPFNY